tara:strand:- start:73 stop:522 length:450 start_codon:yes stop_codon:yes gene_type:complete
MSSSEFKFIIVEIPKVVSLDSIRSIKNSIKDISAEDALVLNSMIELDTSDIIVDDLSEDDLFHIGKESLKAKHAIHVLLEEAIDYVLLPRINIDSRTGSMVNDKEFAYLELENKTYAVSGDQVSYYGSKTNRAYDYLLALNLSGILNFK